MFCICRTEAALRTRSAVFDSPVISVPVCINPCLNPGLCKKPEKDGERYRLSPALGESYTAKASKAVRSLITSIGPSRRINRFLRSLLRSRVTVSREAPMRIAISSWVIGVGLQPASGSSPSRTACESNSRASLPAEDQRFPSTGRLENQVFLPSREVVERLTFPEHTIYTPRGVCPSTNRMAPAIRPLLSGKSVA
jgi:hypothetical protein